MVVDVSSTSVPQPIKRTRAEVFPIHFFLANGARPRQKDFGTLVDIPGGVKFATHKKRGSSSLHAEIEQHLVR